MIAARLFEHLRINMENIFPFFFFFFLSLQSFPRWETDSKISCEQTLLKGEGPKTSWTRELTNDGKLILVLFKIILNGWFSNYGWCSTVGTQKIHFFLFFKTGNINMTSRNHVSHHVLTLIQIC